MDAVNEAGILADFLTYCEKNKVADRILQPPTWCLFHSPPKRSISAPFGSYRLNLRRDPELVWAGLHSKHRNVIRNAEKKGVLVRSGPEVLHDFWTLYGETMGRSGMQLEPEEYFREILQRYATNIFCGVVYDAGKPVGGVFVPFTKYGAYYVYGASATKVETTGAVNYLHYQMIRFLMERNVAFYDFVGARLSDVSGTKLEGIQKFKERFGGDLIRGFLWKSDINATKCKLFDLALATKRTLRGNKFGPDIIDQEISKL